MGFADRFRELVPHRGDVARLSEATGMNDSILSKYKRGLTEPTLPQAVAIADYFDVSLDWLAGRDGFERDSHKRPSPALAADEAALVDDFRRLTPREKTVVRAAASTMADGGEPKNSEIQEEAV